MAQPPATLPPVSPEAFLEDRRHFWSSFTSFAMVATIAVVILLVLMAFFLL
ncbi:MAG: hypothetical protein KGJ41_16065 [Rhodospirillales bacterium]|nr:hypothetical protein [Rhodospirillales bacterium]MDE2576651.1 hypothetical protein [Rhodospirillales bacterium]